MVGRLWDLFQPLLFGLIGAEITISTLSPSTVGKTSGSGVRERQNATNTPASI